MRRIAIFIGLLILAVALVVGFRSCSNNQQAQQPAANPTPTVDVSALQKEVAALRAKANEPTPTPAPTVQPMNVTVYPGAVANVFSPDNSNRNNGTNEIHDSANNSGGNNDNATGRGECSTCSKQQLSATGSLTTTTTSTTTKRIDGKIDVCPTDATPDDKSDDQACGGGGGDLD